MAIDLGKKGYLYPQAVLVLGTYDEKGVPDAMTAAWGMMGDYDKVCVCLALEHKTVANFKKTGALTIAPATARTVKEADYLGLVSGNDVPDKVAKAGLHAIKSEKVNAPIFEEFPLTLECKVVSLDEETGFLLASIENVRADESILTNGHIDTDKLEAIAYDPDSHDYLLVKGRVGKAFHDGLALKK